MQKANKAPLLRHSHACNPSNNETSEGSESLACYGLNESTCRFVGCGLRVTKCNFERSKELGKAVLG